jgi:hypothetical protein
LGFKQKERIGLLLTHTHKAPLTRGTCGRSAGSSKPMEVPSPLSSRAKPRDLQFCGLLLELFFKDSKRSGLRGPEDRPPKRQPSLGGTGASIHQHSPRAVGAAHLHCIRTLSQNISRRGPQNRRSLGCARDDKGKGDASMKSGWRTQGVFHLFRWGCGQNRQAHLPTG